MCLLKYQGYLPNAAKVQNFSNIQKTRLGIWVLMTEEEMDIEFVQMLQTNMSTKIFIEKVEAQNIFKSYAIVCETFLFDKNMKISEYIR